jgi:hypothetical protein
MLILVLLAFLITLLASLGVGASLWYYIHISGSYPTITHSTLAKDTLHSGSPSTAVPTPSTSSEHIAAVYNSTFYDISADVTTAMSLAGILQVQMTIHGSFAGLHRTGMLNGSLDPGSPNHIRLPSRIFWNR